MSKLFSWGPQGGALIDRWTLVHLAFWFVIGANMEVLHIPHWFRWPGLLLGAFAWEVLEELLEVYTDMVAEPESRLNRWISDPLMAIIGGAAGMYLVGG